MAAWSCERQERSGSYEEDDAGTDIKLNAEILSYSRSNGAFAGVSLDGSVVQADKSGDKAMYGPNVSRREILDLQGCGS